MGLGLADRLSTLVRQQYAAAQAAGALTFASSEMSVVKVQDVSYQLRYCPSLANKPRNDKEVGQSTPKSDPFENPTGDLLIGRVPGDNPSHVLVLNKFPIIKEHFILATAENKPQTHLLEQLDFEVVYECLKEWERGPDQDTAKRRLFAFFNSGQHSGASQAHRHVQFLPAEIMGEGVQEGDWSLLADEIVQAPDTETGELSYFRSHRHLPFQHFGTRLPPNPSPMTLHQTYLNLYQQCLAAAQDYDEDHPEQITFHSTAGGDAPISYNLAITTRSMVMCPRRNEGTIVRRKDGSELGFVALNGTLLGGTMMVKNQELFELLKSDESKLLNVFESTCVPASLRRITSYMSL